jgi:hypothetical protein
VAKKLDFTTYILNAKAVKCMVVKQLSLTADYLAEVSEDSDMKRCTEQGAAALKAYCLRHVNGARTLKDDAKDALRIARVLFWSRRDCFKHHYKAVLREVNERYGSFGVKHKMDCVQEGIMNFANHYCNEHGDCQRHIWYGKCSAGDLYYEPAHKYVNLEASELGQRCNSLTPAMFKLVVASWVYSREFEQLLWKTVACGHTTINESYFHSLSSFVPKLLNYPAELYEEKEAAHFLSFQNQCESKEHANRVLVHNKNAGSLVNVQNQKLQRFRAHINRAIAAIVTDKHTQRKCADDGLKEKKRRSARHAKVANGAGSQSTAVADAAAVKGRVGMLSNTNGMLAKRQRPSPSAMPCPPYPFANELLLVTRKQKQLLADVHDAAMRLGLPALGLNDVAEAAATAVSEEDLSVS